MKSLKDTIIERIADKLKESKENNAQDLFEKRYQEYKETIEDWSGELIPASKADFIKMYAFYASVIYPDIVEMWESYLGRKLD